MWRSCSSAWLERLSSNASICLSLSLSQRSSVPSFYGRWGGCPGSHNLCNAKIERVRAAHLTPQLATLITLILPHDHDKKNTVLKYLVYLVYVFIWFHLGFSLLLPVYTHSIEKHCKINLNLKKVTVYFIQHSKPEEKNSSTNFTSILTGSCHTEKHIVSLHTDVDARAHEHTHKHKI